MTRLSTSGIRREYGPECAPRSELVTISLHGDGRITVRDIFVDAFRALNACLIKHDYRTRRADTGAFNCRKITGGSGLSPHAFGGAADLNWLLNPYGRKLITDMPAAMVADIKAIKTRSGEGVFRWGGDYNSVKDAMHWEVICSKRDLLSGINPKTVPGGVTTVSPTGLMRRGSTGDGVRFVQALLDICLPGVGPVADGDFGPATEEAVREFQTFARSMQVLAGEKDSKKLVAVDGIAGGVTLRALAFWVPTFRRKWIPFAPGATNASIYAANGLGNEVFEVQLILTALSRRRSEPKLDPEGIDGKYGPNSVDAFIHFAQEHNGVVAAFGKGTKVADNGWVTIEAVSALRFWNAA